MSKKGLVEDKVWYPPKCKTDVEHLVRYCCTYSKDNRGALDVLSDIEYRVVHPTIRGRLRGFKHDRKKPSNFLVTIKDTDTNERETVPLTEVVKIERIGEIPKEYQLFNKN